MYSKNVVKGRPRVSSQAAVEHYFILHRIVRFLDGGRTGIDSPITRTLKRMVRSIKSGKSNITHLKILYRKLSNLSPGLGGRFAPTVGRWTATIILLRDS